MKLSRADKISIFLIIVVFAFAFYIYPTMPEKMPTHWNSTGEIDGYGNRFMGVFLFPIIMVFIYLLFLFIPKIAVYKESIASFKKYLEGFKLIMVLFFLSMYTATLLPNFGIKINMIQFIVPVIAILFYYIGHILPFIKKNYFIGIRTPWTLANEGVWEKTHKLGGKTFKISSLLFLTVLLSSSLMIWVVLGIVILNVFVLFGYSYFIWGKLKK